LTIFIANNDCQRLFTDVIAVNIRITNVDPVSFPRAFVVDGLADFITYFVALIYFDKTRLYHITHAHEHTQHPP